VDTGLLSHTIGTGTGGIGMGDGSLKVQVTSTGAFGSGSFPASTNAGATYDPLGILAAADTVVDSEVFFRASTTSRTRATLESLATNRSTIRGSTDEAISSFDVGSLHFALTQL